MEMHKYLVWKKNHKDLVGSIKTSYKVIFSAQLWPPKK